VTALTLSMTVVPILALVGGVGGFIAALRITHGRRQARLLEAQEALRVSEERLRFALAATTEIVWDWDLRTDAMYQPLWAQVYGYPENLTPRTGKELLRYMHPDDLGAVGAQVEEASRGARAVIEIEHRMKAASGEWRWMLVRARVVAHGSRGEALRIVGTCADVTERRRMLERLQLADRMVSVGTLAAGVAHEINNPLAFVSGNLTFALDALDAIAGPRGGAASAEVPAETLDECRTALREASEGAQRVHRIVRDLKTLSRSNDEPRAPVDVTHALETALHLARNDLAQRARLVTHIARVPPVLADESRLSQVFLNLLVNAAQAIPEGRPEANRVEVTLDTTGELVVLTVRDTGCGIPQANLGRIFDPFFTTKPVGIGTGLGLAISHGIVSALGGELDVTSEPGRGSTFRVTLPAAAGADAATSTAQPAERPAFRSRVLVVDDEPLFCSAVARMIGREHEVVTVADPGEALRRIEKGERFDAVLSDLVMPGMTGMDLHTELERVAPHVANRMLFVTGGAFTSSAAQFVARMQGRVLEKPLEPELLLGALAAAMRAPDGEPDPPSGCG